MVCDSITKKLKKVRGYDMTREQWAKLSEEEQKIKVAELCGWMYDGKRVVATGRPEENVWIHNESSWHSGWARRFELPNYLNDLNAMHEAEKRLSPEDRGRYEIRLGIIYYYSVWHSTAAQRAEAFVLTMDRG